MRQDLAWMENGECRRPEGADAHRHNDLFFPDAAVYPAKALQYCRVCPVTQECLAFALAHGEDGIWGGTTEKDRRKMKRRARRIREVGAA